MSNAHQSANWKDNVKSGTGGINRSGLIWVGGFLLVFGIWAILVPLAGAVVANGKVISAGNNKIIQHLGGGSILAIHARDGDTVKKGDLLFTLDPINDSTELERLSAKRAQLRASEARFTALMEGKDEIEFPREFFSIDKSGLRGAIDQQQATNTLYKQLIVDEKATFMADREALEKEIAAFEEQIEGFGEQINGFAARLKSNRSKLGILRAQEKRMAPLAAKGYIARAKFDELKLQIGEVQNAIAGEKAEIAGLEHRIAETKSRIVLSKKTRYANFGSKLTMARSEIAQVENQMSAVGDSLDKREIRAPVSGIVARSTVHTIGGVIAPGERIAEIVPTGTLPLIEARVLPQNIDSVATGQEAEIQITAFNARLNDPIKADVVYIEADSKLDEITGEIYFTVRLEAKGEGNENARVNDLKSGMLAQVFIKTEPRTFLAYLLKPISESFQRAFRD